MTDACILGKATKSKGIRGFHAFASSPVHIVFHTFGGSSGAAPAR
jgi:hypothetical protein